PKMGGGGIYELEMIFNLVLLPIAITAGPVFAHSISREFTDRELITLLTQPVEKWMVISAKLITNTLMLYLASALPLILETYLLLVEKPVVLLAILVTLLIHILFVSSVVTALALTTKNIILTILGSLFLFLGLDFLVGGHPFYKNLSPMTILCFLEDILVGTSYEVSLKTFLGAFFCQFSLPILLLILCVMYFHYVMQLD
ncbi:MAG: hypothetical protein ACETVR_02085, partial [Candidatus Bathyarchaeia archaeon]